jgi:ribosomal protein S18 acetylase RimI-like enzyme
MGCGNSVVDHRKPGEFPATSGRIAGLGGPALLSWRAVSWTQRALGAGEVGTVLGALRAWEPVAGCGWQLQAGDLGWALRFEPAIRDEQIRVWWDAAGEPAAVVLSDQPSSSRCAINPAHLHDPDLAEAIVADLRARLDPAGGGPWIDPPPGPAALTRALLSAGFEPDPDLWLHLWLPLPAKIADRGGTAAGGDPGDGDRGGRVRPLRDGDVAARVALQRAAFPGSSLTADRYRRLRTVPGHRPELDLVHEAADGTLTAFCVAWLGPDGGTGLLEPVGSDPAHRRAGHARAVVTEAFRRLTDLGATGVAVLTPVSNQPAVRFYRSLGMAAVAERRSYWPAPDPA